MIRDYLVKESSSGRLTFQENKLLAPYTTFGIGGPCDYFVRPKCEEALILLIRFLRKHEVRFFILGNGSNLLFDDRGYRGVVISTDVLRQVVFSDTLVEAACGASLIALSHAAARHSLDGLTFACGIPGTIGGAIFMNAGAHGGEIADIVLSSRFLDTSGEIKEITDHRFSYRHSIYQENGGIILSCKLGLACGNEDEIKVRMCENKYKRESTQPTGEKSAGSVFRRLEGVIPAALIDRAGLKGYCVGDAAVSEKHAGFIVNKGCATASDVLTLIERIKEKIFSLHGVTLIPEIRYIGETEYGVLPTE